MRPKMKMTGSVLGLVLAATLAAGARPAGAWQYTLDGVSGMEASATIDMANSVVVDAAGDIIAGGAIGVAPYIGDGLVMKLNGGLGAPSVLWQTRFTSDFPILANSVNRVALDEAGNILVAGRTGGIDAAYNMSTYFLVAKLDGATGAILWEQRLTANTVTAAHALALDSGGNVIAAGQTDPESDWAENWTVVKFNGATGTVLWQATGPDSSGASSVAVDQADNVIVGGYRDGGGGGDVVVKYDGATGAELWVAPGPANSQGNAGVVSAAVVVDAVGNVVTGGSFNDSNGQIYFHVRKLTPDGTDVWDFTQEVDVPSGGGGAYGLILDGAGNVFATGAVTATNPAAYGDMATLKLDGASGAILWQSIIDGGADGFDVGNAIALDPAGNPVVGGTLQTATRGVLALLTFNAATGAELWRALVDGAGTDDLPAPQQALDVAIDPRGDVIAGGWLNPVTGNFGDFAVVKRNGADGSDFVQLCGNGVPEGSETCDDGNTAAGDGCSATCQTEPGFLCQGEPSTCVATIGVVPKKLLVLDKLATSGSAKTVFAAKDTAVSKGAGTDATAISATFTAAYANGAARGGFTVPAGAGWLVNTAKVAKYVNKTAPAGPTQTKVALIRPGSALSLTAKGIGDTPFDILAAGDPAGDVNTAYCVSNGGPTICHCSVNQGCVFTRVAGETGAKLKCKGGVADPTCAALVP